MRQSKLCFCLYFSINLFQFPMSSCCHVKYHTQLLKPMQSDSALVTKANLVVGQSVAVTEVEHAACIDGWKNLSTNAHRYNIKTQAHWTYLSFWIKYNQLRRTGERPSDKQNNLFSTLKILRMSWIGISKTHFESELSSNCPELAELASLLCGNNIHLSTAEGAVPGKELIKTRHGWWGCHHGHSTCRNSLCKIGKWNFSNISWFKYHCNDQGILLGPLIRIKCYIGRSKDTCNLYHIPNADKWEHFFMDGTLNAFSRFCN